MKGLEKSGEQYVGDSDYSDAIAAQVLIKYMPFKEVLSDSFFYVVNETSI